MMKKLSKYILALLLPAFVSQSCTDQFEEINTNPNSPVSAPVTNVLGYVLYDFSNYYFGVLGDMNEPETYSGFLGKIQYIDDSRYMFTSTNINTLWTVMYRDLKNTQLIIDKAEADGSTNMKAVALTLQAYMAQIATDRWRDIPYSEAFKGDAGYITPKYDTQETIYPAIVAQLKTAADLFASGGTDVLGEGDLLYGGDVAKWRKFCNSLRLRVAIRLSGISSASSKSTVEEITGAKAKYPVFESNGDNAFMHWTGSSPYIEPWNNNFMTRDDHGPSDILINKLTELADPRLPVYAKPAPSDGTYRGVVIGPATSPVISLYSRVGTRFRENASGFSPWMRYSEVAFILAEAATKGWSVGGATAKSLYESGVTASLEENGITGSAEKAAYLAQPKVAWDGVLEKLYIQKWLSLYKNGQEAWAETRRTDVPRMPAASGSPFPGHDRPPFRYPYPPTESTLNGTNNAGSAAQLVDNFWGKQMWWDTRTGVK